MEEVNGEQVLSYLKSKYLTTPPSIKVQAESSGGERKKEPPAGIESEFSGDRAEMGFLMTQFEKIKTDLVEWLDILKKKVNY
jgi:hypothetical protein